MIRMFQVSQTPPMFQTHEPLAGLMFTKAQYESLAPTAVYREPVFPSWVEWNKLQMRAAGAALKQGVELEP